MSDWTQVGENLVKHVGGTVYLRAKVKGKVIKVSLQTNDLRIAKLKRDERLAGMRAAAVSHAASHAVRILADAVSFVTSRLLAQPQLNPATVNYYLAMLKILNETLPLTIHGRTWTAGEAAGWWKRIAGKYAASACKQRADGGKAGGQGAGGVWAADG